MKRALSILWLGYSRGTAKATSTTLPNIAPATQKDKHKLVRRALDHWLKMHQIFVICASNSICFVAGYVCDFARFKLQGGTH